MLTIGIKKHQVTSHFALSNIQIKVKSGEIYALIGKFRSNFKLILFDAILEEDEKLLNKSIHFVKLIPCNNLDEQIFQLREHKDFFIK